MLSIYTLWGITCDRMNTHTTSRLLTIQDLAVFLLLLSLLLANLLLLLTLHFLPLMSHSLVINSVTNLNIFRHLVLLYLPLEDTLVGVLHLSFVNTLLLNLLLALDSSLIFTIPVLLLQSFLFLLLLHRKITHMLLVNLSLFVQGCTLGRHKALLVC